MCSMRNVIDGKTTGHYRDSKNKIENNWSGKCKQSFFKKQERK